MSECSCKTCQDGCTHKPGWFLPGEAEKAAEYLNLTLKEFFDEFMGVDWLVSLPADIYILAPSLTWWEPGQMYPSDPRGRCIFYEDGLCKIHPVKPYECAVSSHDSTSKELSTLHKRTIPDAWRLHQSQISELLGMEPHSTEDNF